MMNQLTDNPHVQARVRRVKGTLLQHAVILGGLVMLLWTIEFMDWLIWQGRLDFFGIMPRTAIGLRNIALSPFLHDGPIHLMANTLPLLLLGWFVMLRSTREFFVVTLMAATVSGLGIWLFGAANSIHIGFSGVIFGYLGYLLFRGYFERSIVAIVLAVLALIFYGGMIFGVLPIREGVSWLGHLFGLLGGILAAYVITRSNGRGLQPKLYGQ
jgi:membrane associated rhomboid family serine protease